MESDDRELDDDELRRERAMAKLRALWRKDPAKVRRLMQLELERRAALMLTVQRILAAILRQSRRIETLAKLAIARAKEKRGSPG